MTMTSKKQNLDNYLDTVLSENTGTQVTQEQEPIVVENNKTERRGRKKAEHTQLEEGSGNSRTSIIVNTLLFEKLKEIAKRERVTHTQLLTFGMQYIVENYERKHGEIKTGEDIKVTISDILG